MVEQGVLSVTMGTMIGFGTNSFAKQIREHLFTPIIRWGTGSLKTSTLNRFLLTHVRTPVIEILSATLELLLILGMVLLFYKSLIMPLFKEELKEQKEENKQDAKWKQSMLTSVRKLGAEPLPYSD